MPAVRSSRRVSSAAQVVLTLGCLAGPALAAPQAPRPPAFPWAAAEHPLGVEQVGRLLLDELRCAACHELPGAAATLPPGPDLSEVGWRMAPDYLERFIADPAASHPGTKMPAMLEGEPANSRRVVAFAIARFLASLSDRRFEHGRPDAGDVAAGRGLFHRVGCVACHAPREPALEDGRVPEASPSAVGLEHVPAKYGLDSLADFLFQPLRVRPAGRMPDMALTRGEARSIASYLIGLERDPVARGASIGASLVAEGREFYVEFKCVACHTLAGLPSAAPVQVDGGLDPARGCLTEDGGRGARFTLDAGQRVALGAALEGSGSPPTDAERIATTLTAFNCIGCHTRDGYGGVRRPIDAYFETDEHDLGDHARIPPTLSFVGAKLRTEWLQNVLFDAASVRPYMHTRMPQFGEANLGHLPALLARTDSVEPYELRTPEGDAARAARDAGRELLGVTGVTCISCHDFNAKPSPGFRGVDLINSPERLQPSWFARFLIQPQVYRPGIVMPESWPDGVAAHPEILGGDTTAQLAAIWYFLSQGRTAGDPPGIRSIPTDLVVEEVTRTYRGRSNVAGFRGIAVGFPGGLSYAFDANHGALAAIWRGEFLSVRWDGQGAGDFNPRARPVTLPRDLAFYRLPDEDAPWPLRPSMDKENPVNPDPLYPRNHGYRFRGYWLDPERVPTFMYESGAVRVEDRCVAELADGRFVLRRTLKFDAPAAETLYFRVLTGVLESDTPRAYRVPGLALTLPDVPTLRRPLAGSEGGSELLLELALPAGEFELSIDYELLP